MGNNRSLQMLLKHTHIGPKSADSIEDTDVHQFLGTISSYHLFSPKPSKWHYVEIPWDVKMAAETQLSINHQNTKSNPRLTTIEHKIFVMKWNIC